MSRTDIETTEIDLSRLSSSDRLRLAYELLDSVVTETLVEPFTDEQLAEIDRRVADIDGGRVSSEPWKPVRDRWLRQG